jgi:hypothetical protein
VKHLQWSQMQSGTWNGKVGQTTIMVVAWHLGRGWFVAPKLPGLKTVNVESEQTGKRVAANLWSSWATSMGIS